MVQDKRKRAENNPFVDAAAAVADAAKLPLTSLSQAVVSIAKSLSTHAEDVESRRRQIQGKVDAGSRATKHRFTV